MRKQTIKRIGNLVFAGAVAVGAAWPLSDSAYARELQALSSQSAPGVLQYTNNSESEEDKNTVVLLAAGDSKTDLPTLEEYLGKLLCSGCGKRCPLTSLRCNRGQGYVESATAEYDSVVAAASVTVDLAPSASEEAVPADQPEPAAPTTADTERTESATPSDAAPPPEAAPATASNPQTGLAEPGTEAAGSATAEMVDTAIGYLPLAGIACGGVYLVAGGIKKRKRR